MESGHWVLQKKSHENNVKLFPAKSCRRNAQGLIELRPIINVYKRNRGIVSSDQQEMLKYVNDTDVGLRLLAECRTLRANPELKKNRYLEVPVFFINFTKQLVSSGYFLC